jgi:hypothetical protein
VKVSACSKQVTEVRRRIAIKIAPSAVCSNRVRVPLGAVASRIQVIAYGVLSEIDAADTAASIRGELALDVKAAWPSPSVRPRTRPM